jgi:hypothetical protein
VSFGYRKLVIVGRYIRGKECELKEKKDITLNKPLGFINLN